MPRLRRNSEDLILFFQANQPKNKTLGGNEWFQTNLLRTSGRPKREELKEYKEETVNIPEPAAAAVQARLSTHSSLREGAGDNKSNSLASSANSQAYNGLLYRKFQPLKLDFIAQKCRGNQTWQKRG